MSAVTPTVDGFGGAVAGAGTEDGGDRSLLPSFAFAATVVVAGVLASWVAIQRSEDDGALEADAWASEDLPVEFGAARTTGVRALLEQADLAWAAGRIVEPRYDNALYFYEAVLAQDPAQDEARTGLDRVVQWLSGEVSVAVDARDFDRAEAVAQRVVALRPEDAQARGRLRRLERIRELSAVARDNDGGDALVAARTWDALLGADPGNLAARDGRRRALDALVAEGSRAAEAGRLDVARARLQGLRSVVPDLPAAAALEGRIEEVGRRRSESARRAALADVRAAIDAGRVTVGGADDAFALIDALPAADVESDASDAIDALRAEALAALVAAGGRAADADRLDEADRLVARARSLGATAPALSSIEAELAHRRYLADFRAGRYESVLALSQLEVLEQEAPEITEADAQRFDGGFVEVEFTVGTDGAVRDARVRDATAAALARLSLDAIEDWRFVPQRRGGRPIPVRAAIRFSFRS